MIHMLEEAYENNDDNLAKQAITLHKEILTLLARRNYRSGSTYWLRANVC